jgi:hypothetical protein
VCTVLRNHSMNEPQAYGEGVGTCQVQAPAYAPPPREYVGGDGRPSTCFLAGWGSQITLTEGRAPNLDCVGGNLVWPPLPVLAYGQSVSLGAITCSSEPTAVACTDTGSGRFFRMSRDSYQLG